MGEKEEKTMRKGERQRKKMKEGQRDRDTKERKIENDEYRKRERK